MIELSPSLEFEHEVRREVTVALQIMRWFGQADDADERWKMDVEKVVRQLGFASERLVSASVFFSPPSNLV
jgi:hypothetical protein